VLNTCYWLVAVVLAANSLQTSFPGNIMSNMLFISIIRKDAFKVLNRAFSMLCVKHIIRSTDDRSGRALNYWFLIIRSMITS
jgi:hypothetical protein